MSVVKVEMRSRIPSAFASFVVSSGASVVRPEHGEPAAGPVAGLVDRRLRPLDVEGRPVLRLDDVSAVARDAEGGVLGLLA